MRPRLAALLGVLAVVAPALLAWASDNAEVIRYRMLNEALAQAERPGGDWDPGQRDCAGFVRFLYRKCVARASPLWVGRDGRGSNFLVADELLAYNFSPISKEPERNRLRTGDLLAFYNPTLAPKDAWHLMMVLEPPTGSPDRLLVVYHNGAAAPAGAVRKVWLDELVSGPPEWRPSGANPNFLGCFRWGGWSALEHAGSAVTGSRGVTR